MCAPVVLIIAVFSFRMRFLQYRCTCISVKCALCGLLGTFTIVSISVGVYILGTIPGSLYEYIYMSPFLLLPLLHSDCTTHDPSHEGKVGGCTEGTEMHNYGCVVA